MTYQTILYDAADGVATITLNRPEKLNAVTLEMLWEMGQAFAAARDDEHVRAVVLTGAGRGFCSGQDLTAFAGFPTPDQVEEAIVTGYKPLVGLMTTLEKPVIGAVNGVAAGAGASLALACDLRIMADDASLMQAFINIGLVPDAGSTWFMARLVGYSRALEIAIEGERIPASRCLELGLTNRVAPPDQLMGAAMEWARKLAARPTRGIGLTKLAMTHAVTHDLISTLEYEAQLQKMTVVTEDHREGVMAFIEKRQPVFKGR